MAAHEVLQCIPAESGAPHRGEERIAVGATPFPEPGLQHVERVPPQRCTALLAPLALAAEVGTRAGHEIAAAEIDEFGGA